MDENSDIYNKIFKLYNSLFIAMDRPSLGHKILIYGFLVLTLLVVVISYFVIVKTRTGRPEEDEMNFTIEDGNMCWPQRIGCFFLIRAGENVSIDPNQYSFYVGVKGNIPMKLSMEPRSYTINGTPMGGDWNTTYDYKEDGDLWSEGEYLAFDVPRQYSKDEIPENLHEVLIKNPSGKVIFKDTFFIGFG